VSPKGCRGNLRGASRKSCAQDFLKTEVPEEILFGEAVPLQPSRGPERRLEFV